MLRVRLWCGRMRGSSAAAILVAFSSRGPQQDGGAADTKADRKAVGHFFALPGGAAKRTGRQGRRARDYLIAPFYDIQE